MNKKIILWILAMILLVNIAFALGVRPAKRHVDFIPDAEYEFSFVILNNENKEFVAKVYANDILKEYIEFEKTEYHFEAHEDLKEVKYKLKFPSVLTPGENLGKIIIEEELPQNPRDLSIVARLQIHHRVYVDFPRPKSYIKANIDYEDLGSQIEVVTNVTNDGTAKVENLKSVVDVYDGEVKIDSVETQATSLDVNENKQLPVYFDKEGKEYGEYRVLAAVDYDNERLEITKHIYIGIPKIDILRYDKYFVEGEVNDLKFDIKSNWNTIIDKVTAVVSIIENQKEVKLASLTDFEVEPLQEKTVTAFIDLREFLLGEYDFKIKLLYINKTEHALFKGEIVTSSERDKRGIREQNILKVAKGSKAFIFLVVGLVIAVLLIIFSFVMMYTAKRRGGGERMSKTDKKMDELGLKEESW